MKATKLILLITLLTPLASFAEAQCKNENDCLALYGDPAIWDREMRLFEMSDAVVPRAENAIVAVGSSSMRFWHERIKQDLAPLTIIPRGFGGSTMNDVLHHLDTLVLQYKPRAVMIYEGDNDIAKGINNDFIMTRYTKAIERIHAQDKNTRIYLFAVKPSISRLDMWPQMQAFNVMLQALCQQDKRLTYVDVATPMLKDGEPLPHIFVGDDLHMNAAGYDIWRDAVRPVLLEGEARFE